MSFNLVDAAKGLISDDLVNKASTFLGESETGVSKALGGIFPTILGGLLDKTSASMGAEMVAQLAGEQYQSGVLENPAAFLGTDGANLLNKGAGLLGGIFGDKVSSLTNLLSGFAGIKSASTSSLLNMISPLVLAFIGKHASTNQLNAGDLAALLISQQDNIAKAIPSGLNLGSIFGATGITVDNTLSKAKPTVTAAHHNTETTENEDSGLKWLLSFLLLALIAAAAWYFMGKGTPATDEHATGGTEAVGKEEMPATTAVVSGIVDSAGYFVYDLGKMVTIELPNGAGTITVGENSTENKLYQFLLDKNAVIDTIKGNWFEFTNVRFVTGGSKVDFLSATQLKNIVAISKGFPAASFKLGGYTDNTGDSLSNVTLSQKRAEAVVAELLKLGAGASSITGAKGYGPQFPIGDNATAEGKAMNRRVAINVKSK